MSNVVVTELVVDARGAEAGSAAYTRAMNAAQAAVDKMLDREEKMRVAQDKATAAITGGATSVGRAAAQWQKLAAAADPVIASTQRIAAVQLQADAAVRRGITTQAEASRVLDIYRQRHDQAAIAARAAGQEADNLLRSLNPAIAAQDRYNASLEQANRLARENLINEQTRRSAIMAAQRALESAGTPRGPTTALQSSLDYVSTVRQSGGSARDSASVFEEAEKAAAALRRELNPLGAAYDQLNEKLDRYRSFRAAQLIGDDELTAATARARAEFDKTAESLVVVGDRTKIADHQFSNLRSQAIDIGTMFAMGASPFMIISSQAGQIYEALAGGKGVNASLRALGEIAMSAGRSVVSALGPVGLAIVGVTTLATGLWYMLSDSPEAKSAEQTIADYDRLVKQLKGTFAVTAAAAEDFFERATRGSITAMQGEAERTVENTQRLLKEAISELNVDESGVFPMINPQRARGLDPIRAQIRELYVDLTKSEITANEFSAALIKLRMDEATPQRMKDFADHIIDALPEIIDLEARLGSAELVAEDLGDAGVRAARLMRENFKAASDELAGMASDMRTEVEQINDAFDRMMDRAGSSADAMAAGQMRDRALAPFRKDARDALDEERFERRAAGLTDEAAAIEGVLRRYQELIDLHAGDAVTVERYMKAREEATAAVVEQFERERQARDAAYELDVRAVTARTAAQKAEIEAERVRIDLRAQGHSEAEAAVEADKTRSLSLARAGEQLTESLRQQTEATARQIEQAQLEYDLIGKSASEVARLQAEFQMLAQAKDAATAAGFDASTVTLTESMKAQAAEIGRLTEATQRLNFERDLLFDRVQATRSPEEQQIAAQLRSMGVEYESAQGKVDAAQLRLNNRLHETNDLMWEMRDAGKEAFLDLIDAIGSGESALGAFAKAFAGIGKQMASAGLDKIFNSLFGGAAASGGGGGLNAVAGALGQLAQRPVTSVASSTHGGSLGQTFGTAPIGAVTRGALPDLATGANFNVSRARQVAGQTVPAQMWNFFAGKGLANHQIAGILGNARAESAFNPAAIGDAGMANGLFQWNDRGPAMKAFVGPDWKSDVQGQLDFAWKELQTSEGKAYRALLKATDVTQATEAFLGFERPHGYNTGVRNSHNYSGRLGFAQDAYGQYANQNVASSTNDNRALRQAVSDGNIDSARRIATGAVPNYGPTGYAPGADPWSSGGVDLRQVSGGASSGAAPSGGAGGLGGFLGKQIAQPGSFLGMEHGGVTIGSGLGTALGGFSQGYSSGSPISGALGGALAGVGGGPVGMAIGAISGAIGGIFGGRAEREKKHREQAAAWEEAQPQYLEWQRGVSEAMPTSGLTDYFEQQRAQFDKFRELGGAAWKYGSNNSTESFQSVGTAMYKREHEIRDAFRETIESMNEALRGGRGMDSPFADARNQLYALGKQLLQYVDDVKESLSYRPDEAGRVDEARAAALAQLDQSLDAVKPLSALAEEIERLEGGALGARKVMLDLGRSVEEADRVIAEKLPAALANLGDNFERSLRDEIDEMDGRGYLASFRALIEDNLSMLADIAANPALNVDTSLVDTFFAKSAQSLVNGAELAGSAFDELIAAFPSLAGVVTSFVSEVAAAATDLEAIAARQLSFQDRLFNATTDTSALPGALTTFDRYADREREEEMKAGGQAILDLEAALAAERLNIIRDFNDQATQESKRAAEEARNFLDGLTRNIREFVDGLRSGADSPLAPKDRLAAAQSQYDAQYALALTGDRDAATGLTSYASDLLEASKAYNASSPAYQSTFDAIVAQLEALPKQVSAEQFIVDAIKETGAATATAVAEAAMSILPKFDQLDTNLNGLLDFDEFKVGMAGTEAELRAIFNEIDFNANGELSKLEAILASDGLTRSALVSAVTSGPSAIGTTLAPHFQRLDANVNGLLDFNEMKAALTGIATDAQIRTMMTVLDENGDGQISKLELLRQGGIQEIGATNAVERAIATMKGVMDAVNFSLVSANARHDNLYNLTAHHRDVSLEIMRLAQVSSGRGFAAGGWVSGPGSGTSDSINARLSNGEFVVKADQARAFGPMLEGINSGRMRMPAVAMPVAVPAGNDNGAVVVELRALRKDIEGVRQDLETVAKATVAGAELVHGGVEGVSNEIAEGNRKQRMRA